MDNQGASLLQLFQFLCADLAKAELATCINFQLLGIFKQTDGHFAGFCMLAQAVDMHSIGTGIDNKITNMQAIDFLPVI